MTLLSVIAAGSNWGWLFVLVIGQPGTGKRKMEVEDNGNGALEKLAKLALYLGINEPRG